MGSAYGDTYGRFVRALFSAIECAPRARPVAGRTRGTWSLAFLRHL